MGDKEYEMEMLKRGLSPEMIRRNLGKSGYRKIELEKGELSQEERDFYSHLFNSILRGDFGNIFQ